MKTFRVCVLFGLSSLAALVGCSKVDEEPQGTSLAALDARTAGSGDCRFGDGLDCGGNGVGGDADTLYRCSGGQILVEQQCGGTCQHMPDLVNDQCAEGEASTSEPHSDPAPPPPVQLVVKFNNWIGCSTDSQCASNWCGCNGGTAMRCLPNSQYPKTCAAPVPTCGTGLICSASYLEGAGKCHQPGRTATIWCCASGKRNADGVCL